MLLSTSQQLFAHGCAMKSDTVLSIDEAAEAIGRKRRMMYYLMQDPSFPKPFIKAGRKLFWAEDIKAWERKHGGTKDDAR